MGVVIDFEPRGKNSQSISFKLFIAGQTEPSHQAIKHIRNYCQTHLAGRYKLGFFDVLQTPEIAEQEKILATPTLIVTTANQSIRIVGDMNQIKSLFQNKKGEKNVFSHLDEEFIEDAPLRNRR